MTARVLVVDDIPVNVKLLEARLMAAYFQVVTADNGPAALSICESGQCDIVLLDVMMPEMDGYEVCRRLKSNPATMHLPVVILTALDSPEDRVEGLEAGADDFLTKPVNDLALITRVKNLARLKMLTDDLQVRAEAGDELALSSVSASSNASLVDAPAKVIVVDDNPASYSRIVQHLAGENEVEVVTDGQQALFTIAENDYELAIISLNMDNFDSLRLCSHLRSLERTRQLPLLIVANADQDAQVSQAFELGVNDYIRTPVDAQELKARMRTQLRRKRYNDCLRSSVQQTIKMAVRDPLTNLYNRRYLENNFENLFEKSKASGNSLVTIMCDIDHFKSVNDTHGHDVGDIVIKEVAERIRKGVRDMDLCCRFGGEEFVIVMPDTQLSKAQAIAERIRSDVESHPFFAEKGAVRLDITMSAGVACIDFNDENDNSEKLLKRADVALYGAKRSGRNVVMTEAA